jgi:hypothetical protein
MALRKLLQRGKKILGNGCEWQKPLALDGVEDRADRQGPDEGAEGA